MLPSGNNLKHMMVILLCFLCALSLMQQWSDNGASFGMCLKHQCVQVRQEGVTDVEDISRCSSKGVIPGNRILSLTENETQLIFCVGSRRARF